MAVFTPSDPDKNEHQCACGARYSVAWQHEKVRDSDTAKCDCCGAEMGRWNATTYPIFVLIGDCPQEKQVRFISATEETDDE